MPTKSKSKSEARSRSKSPGRATKSRSRSRGRSKSPARKAEASPEKKPSPRVTRSRSPGRKAKKVEQGQGDAQVAQIKVERLNVSPTKTVTVTSTTTSGGSIVERQTASASRVTASTSRVVSETLVKRHSARIAEKEIKQNKDEVDAVVRSEVKVAKHAVESDKPKSSKKFNFKFNSAPIFSFIFIFLLPFVTLLITYGCNKTTCTLSGFLDIKKIFPLSLARYFDSDAFMISGAWILAIYLLSLVRVGNLAVGPSLANGTQQKFRQNGFFSLLCITVVLCVLWYNKYPVDLPYKKFSKFAVSLSCYAFGLSLCNYLYAVFGKVRQVNPNANTGCLHHDFALGRDVFGQLPFGLSYKIFCMRITSFTWYAMGFAMLAKTFPVGTALTSNYPVLLSNLMQMFYVAFFVLREEDTLFSYDMRKESFGFLGTYLTMVFIPFVYSMPARYALEHPQTVSPYLVGFFLILYVVGMCVMWTANIQKASFRRNPSASKLDRIVGEKPNSDLLVGGMWKYVRKPNYLGDIMITVAFTCYCGCESCVPYLLPVMVVLILIGRVVQDDAWCREKHGKTWEVYRHRVKARLIPGIW